MTAKQLRLLRFLAKNSGYSADEILDQAIEAWAKKFGWSPEKILLKKRPK
jgi:hypothetical protein